MASEVRRCEKHQRTFVFSCSECDREEEMRVPYGFSRCGVHNRVYDIKGGCPDCKPELAKIDTAKLMSYAPRTPAVPNVFQICKLHNLQYDEVKGCPECQGEKPKRYKEPNTHQKDMLDAIDGLEDKCLKLLAEGKHDKNVRRHNLAANSIEEGFMWLRKAVMKNDDEV